MFVCEREKRERNMQRSTLGPGYMVIGYMVFSGIWSIFGVVPISLSTIKLTIYLEFDLNFGY